MATYGMNDVKNGMKIIVNGEPCVITDTERGLKMSIRHAALNPADVALLDPLAVATLPAHVALGPRAMASMAGHSCRLVLSA